MQIMIIDRTTSSNKYYTDEAKQPSSFDYFLI